jgi:hypothetical protein
MKRKPAKKTEEKRIVAPYKLGRKAIKTDSRTLKLAKYLTPALPTPPVARDWTCGVTDFGMMLNDQLGDCTIAGCGHAVQVWSLNTGQEVTISDAAIKSAYAAWDGYVPGDDSTDNGGVELDVLNNWHQTGLDGHVLGAFAAANTKNLMEIQQAISLFGGVYIGLNLPVTAQQQTVWDVVSAEGGDAEPGSWGGHCVYVVAYDQSSFTCITWGKVLKMTAAFWQAYCDEAYALLGADWLKDGNAPSGFDQATLNADLKAIR